MCPLRRGLSTNKISVISVNPLEQSTEWLICLEFKRLPPLMKAERLQLLRVG